MDFSFVLFVVVVVTGLMVLGYWMLQRSRIANTSQPKKVSSAIPVRPPLVIEYARAFFPVILIVFLLRSFIVEPFRIPSGSMLPSLHIGDFILVSKFSYGVRLPLVHYKIIPLNLPQRGEVMVFRYPRNPKVNYIKRVVGLPGDIIGYRNKQLFINGQPVPRVVDSEFSFSQLKRIGNSVKGYRETIDDSTHSILIDQNRVGRDMQVTVPPGSYFVMGDNRDYSNDSRYWRFVPDDHIVGRAFFIWFSWDNVTGDGVHWSRIGTRIE